MIDKIGAVGSKNITNVHIQPAFKASDDQKVVTKPEVNFKSSGMVELSNYNRSMVHKVPNLDIEPLVPIVIAPDKVEAIEGEKIYDSKGQLHSIIDNKEDLKTIYKIVDGNVYLVTKVDQATGNIVMDQELMDDKWTVVREYNPVNGELSKTSCYDEKGELSDTTKHFRKPDGTEVSIHKFKNGYHIWEDNKNTYTEMCFDQNKKLKSMEHEFTAGNKKVRVEKNFYDGNLISNKREETIFVPNAFAHEILNDPELKPAYRFDSDFDFKGHQGDKTYYSNGALESNIVTTEDGTAKAEFTPAGFLSSVSYGKWKYEFKENGGQIIHEYLPDNTEKTTTYYGGNDSHGVDVKITTPKGEKNVCYDNNGQPAYYWDDVNGKNYSFTKGMLTENW